MAGMKNLNRSDVDVIDQDVLHSILSVWRGDMTRVDVVQALKPLGYTLAPCATGSYRQLKSIFTGLCDRENKTKQ